MAVKRKVIYRTRKATSRRRHKTGFTVPISIVAGFAPGLSTVWSHKAGGPAEMAAEASRVYMGYASTNQYGYNDTIGFHPYLLKYGTLPVVMGVLAHKFIGGKLGLNRMIAKAGIPILRF